MIVNYTDKGWQVVTQRAHGVLAGQIAMQWKFGKAPDYWLETILAIAEHDDAENELDGENLLTPAGGPLNYAMKDFEQEHCEKVIELCLTKSLYIALLTSMHIDFLYKKESSTNAVAKKFLENQKKLRKQWQKIMQVSAKDLNISYRLLEWCDACSLLICQSALPPEQRGVQVSKGPDGKVHELSQSGKNELTMTPWPFSCASFPLHYETRLVKQLKFKSSAEFRECLLDAPVTVHHWQVSRS